MLVAMPGQLVVIILVKGVVVVPGWLWWSLPGWVHLAVPG